MYIKRKLEDTILKYLDSPEIIAIVGPRQCGKTTLLQQINQRLEGSVFISFEDKSTLRLFEQNIDDFAKLYVKKSKYLFIDEFQYAKEGGKNLKYLYDLYKPKIFITGSSAIDLTVKALKFLVGRIFVFNLYPFDFEEFLSSKGQNYCALLEKYKIDLNMPVSILPSDETHRILSDKYEEYLLYGGYPRVVLSEDFDEKKEVLKNIYNTYFLREVKDILGLIDDYKLVKLIQGLALQIGNMVAYNELSIFSEYTYPTLKKYLNFLNKTFICNFIKPYFKNKRSEIVKNPKVYFLDTGLRNLIVNDFRKIDERVDGGALLENGVFMQLMKRNLEPQYWRDKLRHELDFIVQLENNILLAVEVKKTAKDIRPSTLRAFERAYPDIGKLVLFKYKAGVKEKMGFKISPIYSV
jgi:predicted AAA+ superfamily ATPase